MKIISLCATNEISDSVEKAFNVSNSKGVFIHCPLHVKCDNIIRINPNMDVVIKDRLFAILGKDHEVKLEGKNTSVAGIEFAGIEFAGIEFASVAGIEFVNKLVFSGKWNFTINSTETATAPFYDATGYKATGTVSKSMMNFEIKTSITSIHGAMVLKLAFNEPGVIFIVLLPHKSTNVNDFKFHDIFTVVDKLQKEEEEFDDLIDVQISLPKIHQTSTLDMKTYDKLKGVSSSVFDPNSAGLSKLSDDLYVSQLTQTCMVKLDEEGVDAASETVAVGVLSFKIGSSVFNANRPFLYYLHS